MNAKIEQIVELDALTIAPILERAGLKYIPSLRRNGLHAEIAKGAVFALVERDGLIVAYLEFLPYPDGKTHIPSLQIHPDHRNHSTFRQLLTQAHSIVQELAPTTVTSSAYMTNSVSIALHRRLGFREVERIDEKIRFEVDGSILIDRLARYVRVGSASTKLR